jgi:hypothetical protein
LFARLKNVSVKEAQSGLQKIITWTKKFGKRKQKWEQPCSKSGM